MSHLEAATNYVNIYGWPVFPLHGIVDGKCTCGRPDCKSPGKHPRVAGGFRKATTDLDQIREWWRLHPESNIGIPCGEQTFCVVDVDPKHDGDKTYNELASEHGPFPPTLRAETGSGGHHYIFKPDPRVGNSESKIGRGIDTRGNDKGYICVAPSIHETGNLYKWANEGTPLAEVPEWIIEKLASRPKAEAPLPPPPPPSSRPLDSAVEERARAYLRQCEIAIQGQGGHSKLLWACTAMVHGFELDDGTAERLLLDEYNPRCQPMWHMADPKQAKEFRRKIQEGKKDKTKPRGWLLREMYQADEAMLSHAREQADALIQSVQTPASAAQPVSVRFLDDISQPGALDDPVRIPTGIYAIDKALGGGVPEGGVLTVAARTSCGKSSVFRNFAVHMIPCVFTTLEDPESYARQKICSIFGEGDMEAGVRRFRKENPELFINHFTTNLERLILEIDKRAREGCRSAVLDQLSWLHSVEVTSDTYREASHCIQELKLAARRNKMAIVVAVQINRSGANAQKNAERLGLHHIRDSGRIEESSDAVLVIQNLEPATGRMTLDLLKNRQGPRDQTISVILDFPSGCIADDPQAPLPMKIEAKVGKPGRPSKPVPEELTFEEVKALLTEDKQSKSKLVLKLIGKDMAKHVAETLLGDVWDRLDLPDTFSAQDGWCSVADGLFEVAKIRNGMYWRLPPGTEPKAVQEEPTLAFAEEAS